MSKKAIYDQIFAVDGPLEIGYISGHDEVFKKALTVEKETGAVTVATTLTLGERNLNELLNAFKSDLDAIRAAAAKAATEAEEANKAAQSYKIAAEQALKDALKDAKAEAEASDNAIRLDAAANLEKVGQELKGMIKDLKNTFEVEQTALRAEIHLIRKKIGF